jgi:hypothetical protein
MGNRKRVYYKMSYRIKRVLVLLGIVILFATMSVFRHYIEKQSPLKMERLNEMVEKEISETHGKN